MYIQTACYNHMMCCIVVNEWLTLKNIYCNTLITDFVRWLLSGTFALLLLRCRIQTDFLRHDFTAYFCLLSSQLMTKHPEAADHRWHNWASTQWSQPPFASGDQSFWQVPQDNSRCLFPPLFPPHLTHWDVRLLRMYACFQEATYLRLSFLQLWNFLIIICLFLKGVFRMAGCHFSWWKSGSSEKRSE